MSSEKTKMGFIKDCFEEHGRELMDELGKAGFSTNQAIDFLPEVASGIQTCSRSEGIAHTIDNLLSGDASELLCSPEMESIVKKLGLNQQQVILGFEVIAPFFSQSFQKK